MTNTPNSGRNRRTQKTTGRPADVLPVSKPIKTPTAKQPIGRSRELQAREAQMRPAARNVRQMSNGSRAPLYSDFDVPAAVKPSKRKTAVRRPSRKKSQKRKNSAIWTIIALFSLICTAMLGLAVAPQMIGVSWAGMPNFAFVNGSIIRRDQDAIDAHATYRQMMTSDTIHSGVYIDGIHVGGMTKEEAITAVGTAPGSAGSEFAIHVEVEGNYWTVSSENVPLYRDTAEVVQQAYAVGRTNTTAIRGTGTTPFRQRLNTVQAVWQQPIAFYTVTTYDHDTVRNIVDRIAQSVNREPVNASVESFDQTTKQFTFNPDDPGLYISADDIYQDVVGRLDNGVYFDTISVVPQTILASVTKAELMNSFGLISSFSTKTTSSANRNTNIDLSAKAINGRTVLPGETFSFNQATGQRTAEKGYKPAAAIAGGETFDEIGGGVCQTSSTLFNAVARANLTITDRDPHAWPSNYVEKGEDATVNWPNLDFKFRNDTQWPIFIVAEYANRKVTVDIYGMSLGDGITIDLESETTYTKKPPTEPNYIQNPELKPGTEKVTVKPRTGYTVETYKVWYKNGVEFQREKLHTSHYKMYQEVIEWN